jgi:cyclopropane fatty-acyl-phospholipid synthase-like methyltransferase
MSTPIAGAEQVRRYYDDNTRLFLSLGQGSEGTIHRAVWGPGVENRRQAMRYVDSLMLERLRGIDVVPGSRPRVADLGCGVCASLCFIAAQLPIAGVGITISPAQAELGTRRIAAQGLSDQVRCIQGDFCNLPAGLEPVDLAFGIESFIHAADGAAFFEQASRLVRPGGYLMVCDDLLAPGARENPRARPWAQRFRDGWKGFNVVAEAEAHALAKQAGFEPVETIDLTPYLEMQRPRDYAIGALMRCFGWLPLRGSYWSMLRGGHAAQLSLKRGWIQHLLLVWQRRGASSSPSDPVVRT